MLGRAPAHLAARLSAVAGLLVVVVLISRKGLGRNAQRLPSRAQEGRVVHGAGFGIDRDRRGASPEQPA